MKRRKPISRFFKGKSGLSNHIDKRVLLIIASVLAAAVIAFVIYLVIPKTVVANEGAMSFSVSADGIVVRDELLYQMDVNGKAEFSVQEGQAVAKGDEIAVVYSRDYSETTINDYKNAQTKIYDYIKNNLLKDVLNNDLSNMDAQIDLLTDMIVEQVNSSDSGQLLTLEQELRTVMKDRQDFVREQVNVDSQLQKLYDEETALAARIEGWKKSSTAERDGVVSFYFDGAETFLTPANMKKLTASDITEILNGKSYYTLTDSAEKRPLYRLINANNWYVLLMCDEEIPEFAENTVFKATFRSDTNLYSATMTGMKEDDKKYLYYFSFKQDIGNLLIARNVNMTVSTEYKGLIVPEKALKKRDNVDGVYIKNDKEKLFVPVTVLIKNNGYAIIQGTDEKSEYLKDQCEVYV